MRTRRVVCKLMLPVLAILLASACNKGDGGGGASGAFAPGGVVLEEPSWAQGVAVAYGGEDLDTSVPGSYGYYTEDGDVATVYDADGLPFTFKKGSVKRIVNLWPANTSGILALGAEKFFVAKLGGMTTPWQEAMFPAYAALTAQVGPQAGPANAEALMALEPDLVIGHPSSIANLRGIEYRGKKLPVVNVNFKTYQEMKVTYRVIGKILGGKVEENAEAWGRALQANIDRIAKGLAKASVRPVVYYSAGGMGGLGSTMPSSQGSVVMNEWTGYAGGKYWPELMRVLRQEDIVDVAGQTGVNMELVLKYPPQKVFIGGGRREALDAVLADKDGASNPWAGIIADLGPDNVKYMPYALFDWGRFGAESVLQILWAAANIHPEVFADPSSPDYIDMRKETKAFYTDFAGYPVTDAEVDAILDGRPPASVGTVYPPAPPVQAPPRRPAR